MSKRIPDALRDLIPCKNKRLWRSLAVILLVLVVNRSPQRDDTRRYRIRGLKKNLSPHYLRVNIARR